MTDAFIEGLKLCRLYSDFRPRVLRGPGLGSGPLSLLIWLTSIFWEQKPGVDLEPLSSRVAHVASLSMAEKQLICSFPSLTDITITEYCQNSQLWKVFCLYHGRYLCVQKLTALFLTEFVGDLSWARAWPSHGARPGLTPASRPGLARPPAGSAPELQTFSTK